MTLSAPIAAIERIEKAMKHATPGKWGQFHPSFMPEANGTPFSSWDSSHGVSAVVDGKQVKRLATFTHADDASYLDAVQPLVMAGILAFARQAEEMKRENAELHHILESVRACYFIGRPDCENKFVRSTWEIVRKSDDLRRARSLTKGESDA